MQHQSIKYYTCIDTGASNQSLKLIETGRKALVVGDPSHGTIATASKTVSYFVVMKASIESNTCDNVDYIIMNRF